jgi:hypothetical protein
MGEEREAPARIFTAAGRAELWAAGTGSAGNPPGAQASSSPGAREVEAKQREAASREEVGAAFRRSGLKGDM